MRSNPKNFFKSNPHTNFFGLISCVLMLTACSPEASNAASDGAASQKQSVVIVREVKPEFPQKFIAAMRDLQERCIESRTEIAKAQGWGYSPAADRTPDAEILKLNTKRVEEYFDGTKYAMVETATNLDMEKMDPVSKELSCKLLPLVQKIIKIEYDTCHTLEINYTSKERTEQKLTGACKGARPQVDAAQAGPAQNVEGTQFQCKWNTPPSAGKDASGLLVKHCTLLPTPVHAGTGRLLIAEQIAPDMVRMSASPVAGAGSLSLQAMATTEKAVEIKFNEKIPADKFSAPADSLNFPLVSFK